MDKIYEQTMLFDFYGELLTEHQRSVYEDALYNDLSLSEIAQARGISRQGVHDLIRRCDRILQGYESKLHLVERFARAKKTVEEIERLTYGEKPPQPPRTEPADAREAGDACRRKETFRAVPHSEAARMRETDSQEAGESGGTGDLEGTQRRMQAIRRLSQELLEEL